VKAVTQEKRAAVAHAVSDQPWLTIGKTNFRGQKAEFPLLVEVPGLPNQTVTSTVKVTANGNQRFDVRVTLHVEDGPVPAHLRSSPDVPTVLPASTVADTPETVPSWSDIASPPPSPGAGSTPVMALPDDLEDLGVPAAPNVGPPTRGGRRKE